MAVVSADLEQPGLALAAADAHRHHDMLRTAALALDERMPGQPGSAHAVGMADRDGAAVHQPVAG